MRRAPASLLLAVIGLPLITPLLLADARSQLPACCRRDGKHHCAMAAMIAHTAEGPGFAVSAARCPLFPKAIPVAQRIHLYLVSSRRSFEAVVPESALAVQDQIQVCCTTERTRRERSPPHFTFFG